MGPRKKVGPENKVGPGNEVGIRNDFEIPEPSASCRSTRLVELASTNPFSQHKRFSPNGMGRKQLDFCNIWRNQGDTGRGRLISYAIYIKSYLLIYPIAVK